MVRHHALFLPGSVLPARPAYAGLLEALGDGVADEEAFRPLRDTDGPEMMARFQAPHCRRTLPADQAVASRSSYPSMRSNSSSAAYWRS
jgi:hypothetical protein